MNVVLAYGFTRWEACLIYAIVYWYVTVPALLFLLAVGARALWRKLKKTDSAV